jgi:putative phosphoribosyl transferase
MFLDRYDAAKQLVEKLDEFKNKNAIIIAIPRGGVPLAYYISKTLDLPLEIFLSKKIGHPNNPEFAIGAVTLNGVMLDDSSNDVSKDYLKTEIDRILRSLKEKFNLFMGNRKPLDLKNKTVIIVDDGIATGNTIQATVEVIKKNKPKKIIIAVPVAPHSATKKLSNIVDEFICLHTPKDFIGVGQYFERFPQVNDQEVIQLLIDANKES